MMASNSALFPLPGLLLYNPARCDAGGSQPKLS